MNKYPLTARLFSFNFKKSHWLPQGAGLRFLLYVQSSCFTVSKEDSSSWKQTFIKSSQRSSERSILLDFIFYLQQKRGNDSVIMG